MSFKANFIKIFEEGLREYDFSYCKKLNYFMKLDEDAELIFYIGYLKRAAYKKTDSAFTVTFGVLSLYYESLDLGTMGCTEEKLWENVQPFEKGLFQYAKGDEKEMQDALKKSCQATIDYVLSKWKELDSLESYIEYRNIKNYEPLMYCDKFYRDSLTLIISNYRSDYTELYEKIIKLNEEIIRRNGGSQAMIEEDNKGIYDVLFDQLVKPRDRVFHDVDLLESALCEADKRRETNLMTLHNYGIF